MATFHSKVCVVGAGISGLAVARSLSRHGIPFECFERAHRVGGSYAAGGRRRADVSREKLQFADWPMPSSSPVFPDRDRIASYLRDYAKRFRLDGHIRLQTGVIGARRNAEGGWEVQIEGGGREKFDALVVAGGSEEINPRLRIPPPGAFSGSQIHIDECRDASTMREHDVLVAGSRAEACEAAAVFSYVARSTHISLRRPRYLLPQVLLGRPYDQLPALPQLLRAGSFPRRLRRRAFELGHRALISHPLHGLPTPDAPVDEAGVAVAPVLLERLLHGRIDVHPAIARLEGDHVRFADGSRAKASLIVWCTGSRTEFPFLPAELAPVREGRLGLFWNVFPPGEAGLAFAGLVEPFGSPTRVAECQSEWIAAHLSGRCALPSEAAMRRSIERRRRPDRNGSAPPEGGALRVEQHEYVRGVKKELRAGRRRARLGRR